MFFDLETTGLGRDADITQLSAVCLNKQYNQYVLPNKPINSGASAVTGITFHNGILHHNRVPVDAVTPHVALTGFLDFIASLSNDESCQVILVGHNIERFDIPILYNVLRELKMLSEFMKYVSVCIDTLAVARSIFHGKSAGHDYKQGTLVSKNLGKSYEAHNALADVQSLQELYQEKFHGRFSLSDFAFVFGAHILRSTLRELEQKKVVCSFMC